MGQRDTTHWEDAHWIWGDDAEFARQQDQLHRSLTEAAGRPLLKAEQWAALDQTPADPAITRQYDRFHARPAKFSHPA